MNLEHSIEEALRASTRRVFTTMLGTEGEGGEVSLEATTPEANDGVVALIGVAGPWTGTGCVSCSPKLACAICSRMLMTETTSVNDEVLDAIAELTNMIIGGAKTDLETELGPLGLSIPTVIYGRNFKTKSAIHSEWVVVRFRLDDERLEIKLCLAPDDKNAHVAPHVAPAGCPVEFQ